MKSIFSMFDYWDRVHQFPDRHIKVERNLAWRRKYLHARSRNKQLIFQCMKEETRKVVVLDWEDKIKLQQVIKDLKEIADTYQSPCKELTGINNTIYYLKTIEEKINQSMEKRIILDEQDIDEFHEDAAILRWVYDLMTKEYLISEHSKNMPRFARIINKLKQLQRMKIRLAKKIMRHNTPYWVFRYLCYYRILLPGAGYKVDFKDHRIIKAISLTNHWNARRYINESIKFNKKHPFNLRDVELLNCSPIDLLSAAKQ